MTREEQVGRGLPLRLVHAVAPNPLRLHRSSTAAAVLGLSGPVVVGIDHLPAGIGLGSTSNALIHTADCPVAVVRP